MPCKSSRKIKLYQLRVLEMHWEHFYNINIKQNNSTDNSSGTDIGNCVLSPFEPALNNMPAASALNAHADRVLRSCSLPSPIYFLHRDDPHRFRRFCTGCGLGPTNIIEREEGTCRCDTFECCARVGVRWQMTTFREVQVRLTLQSKELLLLLRFCFDTRARRFPVKSII